MDNNVKDALGWAEKAIEDLPEEYKVSAFRELLRFKLLEISPASTPKQAPPKNQVTEDLDGVPDWFSEVIANLPELSVIAKGNRPAQAAWAVVELFAEGTPATVQAVREKIKVRLGLTPQSSDNTSHTLSDLVPDFLDRSENEDGQGYVYTPTRNITELFSK